MIARRVTRGAVSAAMLCVGIGLPSALRAQAVADTLWLDVLQRQAEAADRRAPQQAILARQAALRIGDIRREWLPVPAATGAAQYLSDVPNIGAALPAARIPSPYQDQYDAYLSARTVLLDPTRGARSAAEHAQLGESEARLKAALWQQRAAVNDAFFAALVATAQARAQEAAIADLTERRRLAAARVTAGAALPSEVALLEAEIARREQSRDELRANADAARDVLGALVGRPVPASAVLAVADGVALPTPDVAADSLRARPEYAQFAESQAAVSARRDAVRAQGWPRLSAFGRGGYGRPGLNLLGRSFDTYWTAGVQLEWSPFTWGRTERDAEVQQLQARALATEEAAFTEALRRAAISARGQIDALARGAPADDRIVALRTAVLAEARRRHDAGELTAADYVARLTDLTTATLDRDLRRLRIAEATARYLTTIGREVR